MSLLRLPMAVVALLLALAGTAPAQAQLFGTDPNAGLTSSTQNVFAFGGRFHSRWVWDTLGFWDLPYEDNYFVGAGYQNFFYRSDWSFQIGAEVGLGARISAHEESSGEVWGGLVFRHDGFSIGDTFRISPAVTAGLSAVTAPIGIEAERAAAIGRDVNLLFYLGPEISITYVPLPQVEAFFRIQHRSGLYGVIAEIDGSNAATVGLRWKL